MDEGKKYMNYSPSALLRACEAIKQRPGLAIRKCARDHSVPESTLRDKLTGRTSMNVRSGRRTIISPRSEDYLAKHLKTMAGLGYGYTRAQVKLLAGELAGIDGASLSDCWYKKYMRRHPDLSLKTPSNLQRERNIMCSQEVFEEYFSTLKSILEKYNLLDQPQAIYNVDETGVCTECRMPKVVGTRGCKLDFHSTGKSPTTTVLGCGNALGQAIPPMIIIKGVKVPPGLKEDATPGTKFAASDSGWIKSDLFLKWFTDHFLHFVHIRPCILLYDGHSTHINNQLIERAKKENVHIFVIPPHTSHRLQPLDVAVFSPFKKAMSTEIQSFIAKNTLKKLGKEALCQLIQKVYYKALTPSNLQSAFKSTGICPFNKEVVMSKLPRVPTDDSTDPEASERTRNILSRNEKEIVTGLEEARANTKASKRAITSSRLLTEGGPLAGQLRQQPSFEADQPSLPQTATTSHPQQPPTVEPSFVPIENCQIAKKSRQPEPQSQQPGPSKPIGQVDEGGSLALSQTSTISSSCDDVCCVCTSSWPPKLSRRQLLIINWAKCDNCGEWVHLEYCTPETSVENGEDFLCPFCKVES